MNSMQKPIKISIVTPSFNQGRFIEKAIRSVLDQGYDNFEHIIMDNCSSDETAAVAARYPHLRFVSQPDEGQSDALNKGFMLATGDVIGWLNADDYYLPGAFAKIQEAFSGPIDAVYSHVQFVNEAGQFIRNLKTHRPVKWMSLFYTYIQSTSFFFRRDIIVNNELLDKSLHYCMDMEYFARLLYSGYRFKFLNHYLACFRWHSSNKTNHTADVRRKHMKESFYIINKITRRNFVHSARAEAIYLFMIRFIAMPVRRALVLTSA